MISINKILELMRIKTCNISQYFTSVKIWTLYLNIDMAGNVYLRIYPNEVLLVNGMTTFMSVTLCIKIFTILYYYYY